MTKDFRYFVFALWHEHDYLEVAPLSEVEYDIGNWLQHGPRRRIILAFRGTGKSYLTAAYVLWRLYKDPSIKVLLVSASLGKAKDSLVLIKQWIQQTSWLAHLRPSGDQRTGAEKFDVAGNYEKDPSIAAYGISGQITGSRGHLIVGDDLETPETSLTRDLRVRLRQRIKDFDSIMFPANDKQYSEIVLLMTPQHEETIATEMTKAGYIPRSWPSRLPTPDESGHILGLSPLLQRRLDDGQLPATPTTPLRFDDEDLRERETAVGRSTFAMQFQLNVGLSDANLYPLKLSDLIVFPCHATQAPATIAWGQQNHNGSTAIEDIESFGLNKDMLYGPIMVDKVWHPYSGTYMHLDAAGGTSSTSGRSRTDETSWAVASQLHGYIYLKELGAYEGPHSPLHLGKIVDCAKRNNVSLLQIETNFGGDMLIQLLTPLFRKAMLKPGEDPAYPHGWACAIEGIHNTGQKELRIINTLEGVFNQHRVVVDPKVAADEKFQKQLTRLTRLRNCLSHDDRIEAAAGAVSMWSSCLVQDADVQRQKKQDQDFDEMIAEYQSWARRPGGKSIFPHAQ